MAILAELIGNRIRVGVGLPPACMVWEVDTCCDNQMSRLELGIRSYKETDGVIQRKLAERVLWDRSEEGL